MKSEKERFYFTYRVKLIFDCIHVQLAPSISSGLKFKIASTLGSTVVCSDSVVVVVTVVASSLSLGTSSSVGVVGDVVVDVVVVEVVVSSELQ